MVWVGIIVDYKTDLHVIGGSWSGLNTEMTFFIQMLDPLKVLLRRNLSSWTIMLDLIEPIS